MSSSSFSSKTTSPLWAALSHRKPISQIKKNDLHPTLTLRDLIVLGISVIIGAGIYTISGVAAAKFAGPGLCFSFVVSAANCFLVGLSFAELCTALPVVGSSYIYSYVFLGEGAAFTVGVCLAMENLFAASAVAVGFSAAFSQLLYDSVGVVIPRSVSSSTFILDDDNEFAWNHFGAVNLIAVMLLSGLSLILSFGVAESATTMTIAVVIKISVLLALIFYGVYYMFTHADIFHANHTPFVPPADETRFGRYGLMGIFAGASASFFAFIGFDSVCAMAAEAVDPTRDIPRALGWTLVLCTALYIAVTYFLTGLVNYTKLNVASPVTFALQNVNAPFSYLVITDIGAVAGLFSVAAACLLAQSRVVFAIALDHLVPNSLADVHEKFKVPRAAIAYCCVTACALAAIFPIDVIGDLVSFGTLVAFLAVQVCVIKKRRDFPDMETPFRVPSMIIPYLGFASSLSQIFFLPLPTLRNFSIVLVACYVFYFFTRVTHVMGEVEEKWKKAMTSNDTGDENNNDKNKKTMEEIVDEVIYGEELEELSSPNHKQHEDYLKSAGDSELHHYHYKKEQNDEQE